MPRATRYLPTVDWKTIAKNVILLTEATETLPATFRVTVKPVDVNEQGAALAVKKVGFYLVDYVGHIYKIIAINVDGQTDQIEVSDDFFTGVCPQIERPARIYESVWKGRSPYLAPVKLDNLDKTARDYLRSFELDVLFSNDPNAKKIPFATAVKPTIENYQLDQVDPEDSEKIINYAYDYGEKPIVRLFIINDENSSFEYRQISPVFTYIDGLIDTISFDYGDPNVACFLIISK